MVRVRVSVCVRAVQAPPQATRNEMKWTEARKDERSERKVQRGEAAADCGCGTPRTRGKRTAAYPGKDGRNGGGHLEGEAEGDGHDVEDGEQGAHNVP